MDGALRETVASQVSRGEGEHAPANALDAAHQVGEPDRSPDGGDLPPTRSSTSASGHAVSSTSQADTWWRSLWVWTGAAVALPDPVQEGTGTAAPTGPGAGRPPFSLEPMG